MTAVAAYWNRLSGSSRVLLVAIPALLVAGGVATVALALAVPPLLDFLGRTSTWSASSSRRPSSSS